MKTFTIYDSNSGGIIQTVSCPENLIKKQVVEGQSVVEGLYAARSFYIDQGVPLKRRENPSTSTLTGTTLENVPENSTLTVDGQQYPVSGTVELDFTPGTYRIKIESPVQYKTKELTVEINP